VQRGSCCVHIVIFIMKIPLLIRYDSGMVTACRSQPATKNSTIPPHNSVTNGNWFQPIFVKQFNT
jgi:hypothetical protein